MARLLTRKEFGAFVFERDKFRCVFCGELAVDPHHILERRLFDDGGYFLNNGISVCAKCHIDCETTHIGTNEARARANILDVIKPRGMFDGDSDKWGNPILSNGRRLRGELFSEEPVQKVLKNSFHIFESDTIMPRIRPGIVNGDTIRFTHDGSYPLCVFRNFAFPSDQSPPNFASDIPEGWSVICFENKIAFIWDNNDTCLSWNETLEWATLLGTSVVNNVEQGNTMRSAHSFLRSENKNNIARSP